MAFSRSVRSRPQQRRPSPVWSITSGTSGSLISMRCHCRFHVLGNLRHLLALLVCQSMGRDDAEGILESLRPIRPDRYSSPVPSSPRNPVVSRSLRGSTSTSTPRKKAHRRLMTPTGCPLLVIVREDTETALVYKRETEPGMGCRGQRASRLRRSLVRSRGRRTQRSDRSGTGEGP